MVRIVYNGSVSGRINGFQFPSNGKVYGKPDRPADATYPLLSFQFPSNGKVYGKGGIQIFQEDQMEHPFQFPSNGKVYGKSAYFAPSGDVGSYTPNPNANCAVLFLTENLPRKSHKPL